MVGRSDLRILARAPDGSPALVEITRRIRRFHDALLEGGLPATIVGEAPGTRRGDAEFDLESGRIWAEPTAAERARGSAAATECNGKASRSVLTPDRDAADRLQILASKLGDVAASIERAKPNLKLVCAILFDTRRQGDEREPIAAAPLLGRWLAERLGLAYSEDAGVAQGRVSVIRIATGNERIEGSGARDQPVRRKVAQRINDAIAGAADLGNVAWLAIGGGVGSLKPVIEAAAALHFGDKVYQWPGQEWEKTSSAHLERMSTLPQAAHAVLEVRALARQLIGAGDLAGASAAARRVEEDPAERPWVKRLEVLLAYLHGTMAWNDVLKVLQAESSKRATTLDAGLARLYGQPPKALPESLRPAIRAESALAMRQYVDAAIWTCALFDATLMESISRLDWVEAGPDPIYRRVRIRAGADIPEVLTREDPPKQACMLPARNHARVYVARTGGDGNVLTERWLAVIDAQALRRFSNAVQGKDKGTLSPYEVRNMIVHRMPTAAELKTLRQLFVDRDLWASKNAIHELGDAVLGQPLIRDVFAALGSPDPKSDLAAIVSALRRLIAEEPLE